MRRMMLGAGLVALLTGCGTGGGSNMTPPGVQNGSLNAQALTQSTTQSQLSFVVDRAPSGSASGQVYDFPNRANAIEVDVYMGALPLPTKGASFTPPAGVTPMTTCVNIPAHQASTRVNVSLSSGQLTVVLASYTGSCSGNVATGSVVTESSGTGQFANAAGNFISLFFPSAAGGELKLSPVLSSSQPSPAPTASAVPSPLPTGVLDNTSATIANATGGTITLKSGSSITISPGTFGADQVVTVSLLSTPPIPPQNANVVTSSPTLSVSWVPVGAVGGAALQSFRRAQSALSAPSGLTETLQLPAPGQIPAQSIPVVTAFDTNNVANFLDLPSTYQSQSQSVTTTIPANLLNAVEPGSSINFALDTAAAPAVSVPFQPYILQGNAWVPYAGTVKQSDRILVMTHGILSSLQSAFDPACANTIKTAGGYDQVLGVTYDWTQHESTIAPQYGQFLSSLPAYWLDVEAHSYGTLNTIGALENSSAKARNIILLGGPLAGTPVAQRGIITTILLNTSALGNVNFLQGFLGPNWFAQMQQFTGVGPHLTFSANPPSDDLLPGSAMINQVIGGASSINQQANVIEAAGNGYYVLGQLVGLYLKTIPINGYFTGNYDGIVPVSSAISPTFPGIHHTFFDTHFGLECDQNIVSYVGQNLVRPYTLGGVTSIKVPTFQVNNGSGLFYNSGYAPLPLTITLPSGQTTTLASVIQKGKVVLGAVGTPSPAQVYYQSAPQNTVSLHVYKVAGLGQPGFVNTVMYLPTGASQPSFYVQLQSSYSGYSVSESVALFDGAGNQISNTLPLTIQW